MTDTAARKTRIDYAHEVVAAGKAEPEAPEVYNVVRSALDYWYDFSTAEVYASQSDNPADYRDGLARCLVNHLRQLGVIQ